MGKSIKALDQTSGSKIATTDYLGADIAINETATLRINCSATVGGTLQITKDGANLVTLGTVGVDTDLVLTTGVRAGDLINFQHPAGTLVYDYFRVDIITTES
jgi:hypothetical protein